MYAPRQIVVPVDFSPPSQAAAKRALVFAREFDAALHLVHAVDYPGVGAYSGFTVGAEVRGAIGDRAGEQLHALELELRKSTSMITAEVVESDPVSAIQSAVSRHEANLVLMGTHGYTALKHVFLGSVAERTLRTATCPVLAVRETEQTAGEPIRRILYATDFSSHAKHAMELAKGIASRFGASVEVLNVFVLPKDLIGPYGVPPAVDVSLGLRDQAWKMLEETAAAFGEAGIEAQHRLHQGTPSELIASQAEHYGADLIVMGSRGNTGLKHVFLGSVAERTLRAAHCSVLTTKEGDAT